MLSTKKQFSYDDVMDMQDLLNKVLELVKERDGAGNILHNQTVDQGEAWLNVRVDGSEVAIVVPAHLARRILSEFLAYCNKQIEDALLRVTQLAELYVDEEIGVSDGTKRHK